MKALVVVLAFLLHGCTTAPTRPLHADPQGHGERRRSQHLGADGYTIINVSESQGTRLIYEAGRALGHQIEVATLTEAKIEDDRKAGAGRSKP